MNLLNTVTKMMKRNVTTEWELDRAVVRHQTRSPDSIFIEDDDGDEIYIKRDQAAAIAKLLAYFAEHGTLPEREAESSLPEST